MLCNKPEDNAFVQQKLRVWRLKLNGGTVSPALFIMGTLIVPVGITVFYLTSQVQEKHIDYTFCNASTVDGYSTSKTCAEVIGMLRNMSCLCEIPFTLDEDFTKPVYLYYTLKNYFQNYHRYIKSRDDYQLLGHLTSEVSSNCHPYAYVTDKDGTEKPIAPCGIVANSMFSDHLSIFLVSDGKKLSVPLLRKGIALKSDKEVHFQNPPGDLKEAFKNFAKPPDWQKNVWELDEEDASNNGFQNEDFIVWMRTAALPNFKKLYRLVDHSKPGFENGLLKGNYILRVIYTYPVTGYSATKGLFITNSKTLELSNNRFLGFAYTVVGAMLILFSVALMLIHAKYGARKSQE